MNHKETVDVFSDPRLKNLHQDYHSYTKEDFEVWRILFERQQRNLPGAASQAFLDGLEAIGFTADKVAVFSDANKRLSDFTGWAIHVVPGLIDDDLFFSLLYHKRFPTSSWLRKMKELDYLQEPDMFHDAFAHLPLLTNQAYCNFLHDLAGIALKHIHNPLAIEMLSRIYWFTIEFGLIREKGQLKVYGAGILSSVGETRFCLSDEPKHLDYDVQTILTTPYWKNKFQDKYFIIDGFEQLYNSIPEIEDKLEKELKKPPQET
ncbi:phenylalanine 4-monooxygenase [Negadavirga shengliensis]|uniref:Phenylalanine 4-monooxygenase n=1 Tax=Negadavirga shengliensis TaxID=1389218 RepID=A0ABV9T0Z9_9BACT